MNGTISAFCQNANSLLMSFGLAAVALSPVGARVKSRTTEVQVRWKELSRLSCSCLCSCSACICWEM